MSIDRCGGMMRLAIAAVVAVTAAGSVRAQDTVETFYRGRQINLVVGYGPGGGYDLAARLLARHIGRFIPGNPSVVVQNMAGAGSLRAANFLYGAAPKDGATFGVFGSDVAMVGLVGANPAVQFDPRKFTWLGSSSSFGNDAYVLIVRADAKSPSIAAARRPGGAPIVLGGTGEGARDADVPKILRDALGLNIKQVLGYPIRRRSSSPSSAASSTAAPSTCPPSRRRGRSGSNPTAASTSWSSSRARRATRISRRPHRARTCDRGRCARLDRVFRNSPAHHGAAVRGAARRAGGARQGAAGGISRRPSRRALPRRGREARDRYQPGGADQMVRGVERLARAPPAVLDYLRRLLARH